MRRALAAALLCALATPAVAIDTRCAAEDDPTGLTVVVGGDTLRVEAVAADSPAARAGVLPGDEVRQVNGTVPTSCEEWQATLASARRQELAVLLLLERESRTMASALHGTMWTRPAPVVVTEAPPPITPPVMAQPETSPEPAPPPPALPPVPPLPEEALVTREQVDVSLADLAADARRDLGPYRARVVRLAREVDGLTARGGATDETAELLREIATYHRAAVVAWEAIEATRSERGLRRGMPIADSWTAPYLDDSVTARVLAALPFLATTVVRPPHVGAIERAGTWRPAEARRLLWARADEAQRALGSAAGED